MNSVEKFLTNAIKYGVLIVPFLPLYVASGLFFPFITGKNFAFRIIVEILFAIWVILALRYRKYLPGKSAIVWSVLALAIILLLSTVFSIDPGRSFWSNAERMEGLFGLLHVFAFFLITTSVFNTKDWLRFFWVSLGASFLVSGHGVLQLLDPVKFEIHQGGVRVDANFGNATYLAIYLIFHIFIALYFVTRYRLKWLRWALLGLILLHIFILYNTATRGAILGLLAGLFVTGLLVTFLAGGRARRWGVAVLLVAILVPILFFAFRNASFVQESQVLSRFATISTAETTTQSRFLIWGMAFDAWKDKPILGWGPENFTTVFAQYYEPQLWRQEPWFDRAHNVFLDWLTAAGIIGLLAYLSLFVGAIALLLKIRRGGGFSPLQAGLFAGLLAAYFIHNLFVFDNLISYVMFFAVLGFLHSQKRETYNVKPGTQEDEGFQVSRFKIQDSNYWWRASLSSLAVLVVIFSLYSYNLKPIKASGDLLGSIQAFAAIRQGRAEAIDDAIGNIERALERKTFLNVEIREQLAAHAQAVFGSAAVSPEKRIALMNLAISEMEEQLARSPLDMRARMFLLFLYEGNGEFQKGVDLARETINLAPTRQLYRFLYGSILSRQGKFGEALEQFRIAFEMDPVYPEAVDFFALALLQNGDDSFARDLIEGRYADELRANPEFQRAFGQGQDIEVALNRYRGLDPRFASTFASLGNYELAARIYESLIEQEIKEGRTPDANYFVQYALLKVQLNERPDAIAILERMKQFYTIPQHLKEIDAFIADIRAGKTEF